MLRNLIAISLCCAIAPVAWADAPPEQVAVQLSSFHGPTAGSCLQTPEDPAAFSNRLQQAQCVTVGAAQMYRFESDIEGGHRVRSLQTDGCVDAGRLSSPGTPVQVLACNGLDEQRWDIVYSEGNPSVALLRNASSNNCLAFSEGVSSQVACDPATGQGPEWIVSRQGARLATGAVALRDSVDGECLSTDEFPVSVACFNNGRSNLRFAPLDATGATFRLKGRAADTCMYDQDGTVAYAECITGASAHWRLVETGWGVPATNGERRTLWQVQNVGSGLCLHSHRGAVVPDGETVVTLACDASPNAIWVFERY